jgi:hypothetical protein
VLRRSRAQRGTVVCVMSRYQGKSLLFKTGKLVENDENDDKLLSFMADVNFVNLCRYMFVSSFFL